MADTPQLATPFPHMSLCFGPECGGKSSASLSFPELGDRLGGKTKLTHASCALLYVGKFAGARHGDHGDTVRMEAGGVPRRNANPG